MEDKLRKELDEDLAVDKLNLDELWELQASLYLKYSDELADINYEIDALKETIEVTEAEVGLEIRKREEKSDKKPTEAAIKAMVTVNPKLKKLREKLLRLTADEKLLKSVVNALEHKKKALEKLSDLFIGGYWSTPRSSRKEEYDTKTVRDGINNNLKKKLKRRNKGE